jgi:hypothetical protein
MVIECLVQLLQGRLQLFFAGFEHAFASQDILTSLEKNPLSNSCPADFSDVGSIAIGRVE